MIKYQVEIIISQDLVKITIISQLQNKKLIALVVSCVACEPVRHTFKLCDHELAPIVLIFAFSSL